MSNSIFGDKICTCMCHRKSKSGMSIMHMMACCEFTYEKYINDDGSVDMEIYNKLVENRNSKKGE
jgi:hypothetical protein